METLQKTFTLFIGHKRVSTGTLEAAVRAAKSAMDSGVAERTVIYDDVTCRTVDVDYSGTLDQVLQGLANHPLLRPAPVDEEPEKRLGPGRPKIGVISREVSLLPRHWEWLNSQPNGASGALRVLVEEARKKNMGRDQARQTRDALHHFLWDMAGDFPNFEEATRVFFAKDFEHFRFLTSDWPRDVLEFVAPRLKAVEELKELL